jgi:hypothetical protein
VQIGKMRLKKKAPLQHVQWGFRDPVGVITSTVLAL